MQEKVLSKDILFHDRKEKMDPWQRERYELMQGINHFINCALRGHRELSTGKGLTILYSDFLLCLTDEFEKTIRTREDCIEEQKEIAVFDDFFRIAEFAYVAIKNILQNPGRQIRKVEVKLPAARASAFTGKTMQWMSKRPGRTVAEKISPENKILTTKTVFSVDTKENRELMYLYKNLYEIISTRLAATKCANCNRQNECERDWVVNMQKMIAAYSLLKTKELGEVKAEKQATQNNKLMCDLNYKIVWDAVNMLSHVEEDISDQFQNVARRLACLVYWLLLGSVLKDRRAKIFDGIGKVIDEKGEITFKKPTESTREFWDKIIFVDEYAVYQYSLEFFCEGTVVRIICPELAETENHCILEIDVEDYLRERERYLEELFSDKEKSETKG